LLGLYELNIRGIQLWFLFNDICKSDYIKTINAIGNPSQENIDKINKFHTIRKAEIPENFEREILIPLTNEKNIEESEKEKTSDS